MCSSFSLKTVKLANNLNLITLLQSCVLQTKLMAKTLLNFCGNRIGLWQPCPVCSSFQKRLRLVLQCVSSDALAFGLHGCLIHQGGFGSEKQISPLSCEVPAMPGPCIRWHRSAQLRGCIWRLPVLARHQSWLEHGQCLGELSCLVWLRKVCSLVQCAEVGGAFSAENCESTSPCMLVTPISLIPVPPVTPSWSPLLASSSHQAGCSCLEVC